MIVRFTFKSGRVKELILKADDPNFDFRELALMIEDERLAVFSGVAINMNEVEYFEIVNNHVVV